LHWPPPLRPQALKRGGLTAPAAYAQAKEQFSRCWSTAPAAYAPKRHGRGPKRQGRGLHQADQTPVTAASNGVQDQPTRECETGYANRQGAVEVVTERPQGQRDQKTRLFGNPRKGGPKPGKFSPRFRGFFGKPDPQGVGIFPFFFFNFLFFFFFIYIFI